MAFIYGLRAKDSDQYFYVGCTASTLAQRWYNHKAEMRTGRKGNRHFVNKVKQIGVENVVIEAIEETDAAQVFEREQWWIRHLVGQGVKLVNLIHNGMTPGEWRTAAHQYSLKANWDWALEWYREYQQGVIREANHPERDELVKLAQRKLAEIIEQVLAVPVSERDALIERFG